MSYGFSRLGLMGAMAVLALCWNVRAADIQGWALDRDADPPTYAAISPTRASVDIEELVLACVEAENGPVLQLQLFSSGPSPLLRPDTPPEWLRGDPEVRLTIDGHLHPARLFFADDYAVVADTVEQQVPMLSKRLVDALQDGQTMVLQFGLFVRRPGQSSAFDGEATIDLQAGAGGTAVAAVRRCAEQGEARLSELAR